MGFTPMHKIELAHSWNEIDRTSSDTGSVTVVEKCQHCGAEREVIRFDRNSGPSFRDIPDTELLAFLEGSPDQWKKVVRMMREMFEQLADDAAYGSIHEVFAEINRRTQHVVDGSNLPYRELLQWLGKPKSYRVKNLLRYLQGPACNRCDRIFSPTVELTVDHIDGNRKNAHPRNLQLLCRSCNEEKDDNPPDERDKSPFFNDETPCEHRLTCVEFRALQGTKESVLEEST